MNLKIFPRGRGVHLHDDQTLRECDISTGSQLVLIHTEVSPCPLFRSVLLLVGWWETVVVQ